jgi:outer membrane receptor protein involved in Fe transport
VSDQGVKQEGQQWGLDHGLEIDPFGVGRVEIIKGPAAVLYGSDAIGGVVQVKAAPFPMAGEIKGQLTQLYRSVNDQYGISGELAGHQGSVAWRIRGTLQDYADYRLPAGHTGIDALKALREAFTVPVPAIVVTGSTMTGHEDESSTHDFHLLIKPVAPNKLRAMIAFKLGLR